MLKEGVRLDRVRGGRQKYRRMLDSPYTSSSHMLGHQRPALTLDGKFFHYSAVQNVFSSGCFMR